MASKMKLWIPSVALAAALMASPLSVSAQSAPPADQAEQDHSAHHPGSPETPQAKSPKKVNAQAGMASSGMMMDGGMGQMMSMMQSMMGSCNGMDDRLATLQTKLKLTESQKPLWNTFANALKGTATSMHDMHDHMMKTGMPQTLPEKVALHEQMLTAHLDSLKTVKASLDPFYATLTEEQKKLVDTRVFSHKAMMKPSAK
jgi:hypothetical protein